MLTQLPCLGMESTCNQPSKVNVHNVSSLFHISSYMSRYFYVSKDIFCIVLIVINMFWSGFKIYL